MKVEKIKNILENINYFMGDTSDFIKAFLSVPYRSSSYKIKKAMNKFSEERNRRRAVLDTDRKEIQKLHNVIYKLRRDGLISFKFKNNKKIWHLTSKGIEKLDELQEQIAKGLLPSIIYPKEKSDQLVIIVFDIPELERRKRDWLRAVLAGLEYKMIQKSVWLGKIKVPEKLLEDLKDMGMTDFIEIFSINKLGSLRQIV